MQRHDVEAVANSVSIGSVEAPTMADLPNRWWRVGELHRLRCRRLETIEVRLEVLRSQRRHRGRAPSPDAASSSIAIDDPIGNAVGRRYRLGMTSTDEMLRT